MKFKSPEIPALLNSKFVPQPEVSRLPVIIESETAGSPTDSRFDDDNPLHEKFFYETFDLAGIPDTFDPKKELKLLRERHEIQSRVDSTKSNVFPSTPRLERAEQPASEKVEIQRVAHLRCRLFIEQMIDDDMDVSEERLVQAVELFAKTYGFSNDAVSIYRAILSKFIAQRKTTIDFYSSYQKSPRELVKNLTDCDLPSTVPLDVRRGPLSIDISTDTQGMRELYDRALSNSSTHNVIKNKRRINGFAFTIGKVYYTVIDTSETVGSGNVTETGEIEKVLQHEHQHVVNTLFSKSYSEVGHIQKHLTKSDVSEYIDETNPEQKEARLQKMVSKILFYLYERAKDEIFAKLRNTEIATLLNSKENFFGMTLSTNGNPYDYLSLCKRIPQLENDERYRMYLDSIVVGKYRLTLMAVRRDLATLVSKCTLHSDEIIALLSDTPLNEWTKKVRWYEKTSKKRTVFHSKLRPTESAS